MTTDYEFLVSTSCICMHKNIRVWRLWASGGHGPACLAHSAHPIATPLSPNALLDLGSDLDRETVSSNLFSLLLTLRMCRACMSVILLNCA